ncbi:hypothetical protein NIES21_29440 [Anabaenopsis circularis NIES-21]|uniref:Ester cyclase n=1 Tax=Anabaenopsis circularis NIES-21 TaxID=1085406 RepID=A0A1Z4GHY9_9CYAN|nr:hypothetical protein NIES21_29440 [Anabaenopsis circularis NIES-21]
MPSEQNKSIVLQMYKFFDEGDLAAVQEFLAPNFVAHIPGATESLNRKAFIQSVLGVFRSAFPNGSHQFEDVIAEGDRVVTRGIFSGTHRGELQGIPPTNKQIIIPFFHIDRIVDDQLVEHWGQSDLLGLMQQVGIIYLPSAGLIFRKLSWVIATSINKRLG